jgi:flagellar biosynthesis/type III secretory pathway M-ring protein FliF/YscJ
MTSRLDRDIGPRVGMRNMAQPKMDDLDVNAYIERTPKTNEQVSREKSGSSWEYNFWTIVIVGVIIVLLVLVIWFMYKKDDNTELQKQVQPKQPPANQKQQPAQMQKVEDEMASDIRNNLAVFS